jgi:hypothetical protein
MLDVSMIQLSPMSSTYLNLPSIRSYAYYTLLIILHAPHHSPNPLPIHTPTPNLASHHFPPRNITTLPHNPSAPARPIHPRCMNGNFQLSRSACIDYPPGIGFPRAEDMQHACLSLSQTVGVGCNVDASRNGYLYMEGGDEDRSGWNGIGRE